MRNHSIEAIHAIRKTGMATLGSFVSSLHCSDFADVMYNRSGRL